MIQSVHTFSIVARDPETQDLGVAVASKYLAVGNIVPYAKAHVGAVATQSSANVSYGPEGLRLLAGGKSPEQAINELTSADPEKATRQVGMVDAMGRSFAFTGDEANDWKGHDFGPDYACQGNLLAGETVIRAMVQAFKTHSGELFERLMAALLQGDRAGGDRRGRQSAAILVARERGGIHGMNDRYLDLRVDDHPDAVNELGRIFRIWFEHWR